MKIILVITGLSMGGAENQVASLADKFAERGCEVILAYMLQPIIVKPKNPKVKLFWLGGTKSFLGMIKALRNLVNLIHIRKPDIVHSHMFHANILTRLASLFSKHAKIISTAHSNNEGGALRMLLYRLTNTLSDVFTSVSDGAVQAFEKNKAVSKGNMLCVKNGIDVANFRYREVSRSDFRRDLGVEDKKVFIAIGRLHEAKDYPNLIDAFSVVRERLENVHLLIIGDGELRPDIERRVGELRLTQCVTLLGMRRDIPQLLSAADVFVLSSAWEGFGLVVAEAMACERIAIGTDCGGVVDIIDKFGFVVPPKNFKALGEAMIKVTELSTGESQELGFKARQRIVENYSLRAAAETWLRIYGAN